MDYFERFRIKAYRKILVFLNYPNNLIKRQVYIEVYLLNATFLYPYKWCIISATFSNERTDGHTEGRQYPCHAKKDYH